MPAPLKVYLDGVEHEPEFVQQYCASNYDKDGYPLWSDSSLPATIAKQGR
jgi:hypothetical protein